MKIAPIILLIPLLCVGSVSAQEDLSELEPEHYFNFWVGEWTAIWDEGNGVTGRGSNSIEIVLDSTVIRENFTIYEGANAGFKGTSISVYQPRFERWKQAWADNGGGYYDFTGAFEGNKRIFQTRIFELADGRTFTQRMVFYDIKKDSMTWDWESSNDGGETWNLNWRIFYTRK